MITLDKYTPPTHEDERGMSRDELVVQNIPYAIQRAKVFWNAHKGKARSITIDDVVSSAYEGLVEASHRFDVSKGYKFISFARHWIDQRARVCVEKDTVAHVPVNRTTDFKHLCRVANETGEFDLYVVGEQVGWTKERTERAITGHIPPARLSINDELEDGTGHIASWDKPYDERTDLVKKMLASLEPREAQILRMYHFENKTLQDIADVFGVTRERIRQVKEVAYRKIKVRFKHKVEDLAESDEVHSVMFGHHIVEEV